MNNVPYIIYQFWAGNNPMSENRFNAYKSSIQNFGVKVKLLYKDDIEKMILPDHPLHPGYQYLASIHKSDYLRSYFLNFYGGGYADIKYFSKENNWKECFDLINFNDSIDIIGSKEKINGTPLKQYNNQNDIKKLLVNGWFIGRPHSKFCEEWYKRVNQHMDQIYEKLKQKPGTEKSSLIENDPNYVLRWAEIQGEIFHQLCYDMFDSGCINNSLNPGKIQRNYR